MVIFHYSFAKNESIMFASLETLAFFFRNNVIADILCNNKCDPLRDKLCNNVFFLNV